MQQRAEDYRRIVAAIRFLAEQRLEQPSLAETAAHVGVSPAHFQRIFTRWAGVSPKRCLQYLTLDHARQLLAARTPILEAALATGLSSPGRLHDLLVTWEAMTPGDYAARGEGLSIRWGWFESPFGAALAMATGRGLCGLAFADHPDCPATFADLASRWPRAEYRPDAASLAAAVERAFRGEATRVHLSGTPFQIKVWEALLRIPGGEVTTYADLARAAGRPKAVRAAGTAIGRNPVSWLIPCHRVLQKSGAAGGYRWGTERKRAMLAWEAVNRDSVSARSPGAAAGLVPGSGQPPRPSTSAMP